MIDFEDADAYGELWAEVYDDEHRFMDPAPAVALLTELADRRPTLELGIGTGRVALPLQESDVDVRGVDASPAMVERLRRKPGGEAIDVTIGDMASVPLGGPYGLIFVVFNTFFGLMTQLRQLDCIQNVATALQPGGQFVVECFVPDVTRFRDGGQTLRVVRVDDSGLRLHASLHDPVHQTIRTQVVVFDDGSTWVRPVALRYCWPTELDLMCRLAGLEIVDRWGGWTRQSFTGRSAQHVSVYRRPAG